MLIAASLSSQIQHVILSILKAFANVAFTGSLLLSVAMAASIVWYSKRRPKGAPLSWGQAMAAAAYVAFILFFYFGVVPDRWLVYAEGELGMRSDGILVGPGSTGWLGPNGLWHSFPVVVTKATIADIVATMIYGVGMAATYAVWRIWQARGENQTKEVETSTYGRPLVKS